MVALIILSGAGDLWTFAVSAAMFAVGYGGAASIFHKILADVFDLRAIGAILGLVGLGWAGGAAYKLNSLAPPDHGNLIAGSL